MDIFPLLIAFGLLVIVLLFVGFVVIALVVRAQKRSNERISPLGREGVVTSELSPYGAVLVNGVLWAAVDIDNGIVSNGERVEVVQTRESALAVKVLRKS